MAQDTTAPSPPGPRAVIVAPPERAAGLRLARDQLVAGRYRVRGLLGRGGMGEVYRVTDTALGVDVALKTLPGEPRSQHAEALRREIRHGRRVSHRNVCRMFDLAADGALEFVTMELLQGETLADRLARVGALDLGAALPLLRQIAEGLRAMHEVGVVHRDFKPSNVILVAEPGGERAVVTDFGLARAAGGATTRSRTIGAGTPAYMAPEQLRGEPTTPRADVYAFGVVVYEAIAGRLPFLGDTPAATAMMRLEHAPPRLADPHLDRVLRRALARSPADRFASPLEVVAALERRPGRRWPRRALAASAAAAVAVGAGAGVWRWARGDRAAAGAAEAIVHFGGPGTDNLDQIAPIGDDLVIVGKGSRGARLGARALTGSEGGERSGIVARVRADGGVRWLRAITGPEDVRVNAVAVSSDGRIAIGGFTYGPARSGDMELPDPAGAHQGFVATLDGETGAILWWRALPGTELTSVRSLAFDAGGALYAGGELSGVARFGEGVQRDAAGPSGTVAPYAAAWDRDGALRWVTSGRGSVFARSHAVAIDGRDVVVAGMVSGDMTIGGVRLPAAAHLDGFVLRIDAARGDVRSGRLLQGTSTVSIVAAVPIGAGGLLVAGGFRGTLAGRPAEPMAANSAYADDGFVARLAADGAVEWAVHVAGPESDRVSALAVRGDRIALAGQLGKAARIGDRTLRSHGRSDMLYAELGLDGRVTRAEAIGGSGDDRARSVAIAPDGRAVLAGYFSLRLDHGGATLHSRGLNDGLVLRP